MCTVLLPPGGYPIAVKYIITYHNTFGFSASVLYSSRSLLTASISQNISYIVWSPPNPTLVCAYSEQTEI